MTQRFYWYKPCTPFTLSQGWGILNPAYEQFGFSRHNGIDFVTGEKTFSLYAPLPLTLLNKAVQPAGGGNYITLVSQDQYRFNDGIVGYVVLDFLHLAVLPKDEAGTKYGTGDFLAVANNTGFSTGPHTHLQPRRFKDPQVPNFFGSTEYKLIGQPLDTNDAHNTFDPMPYLSAPSLYARDIKTTAAILRASGEAVEALGKLIKMIV